MNTAVGCSVLLRGFRLALSVEGLRPHTIGNYCRDVERLANYVDKDPHTVSATDIREFTLQLQTELSPKTVHEAQLGIRRFFRFLVGEGDRQHDPTSTIKLTRYKVEPRPTYTPAEVTRLIIACPTNTLNGIRDRAMVLTLIDTGVREGELVSMNVPNFDEQLVRVGGKGGVRRGGTRLSAKSSWRRGFWERFHRR